MSTTLDGGRRMRALLCIAMAGAVAAIGSCARPTVAAKAKASAPTSSAPRTSAAASNAPGKPSGPARRKGEAEFLIAPGGGVIDVPIHASAICVFSFPEKLVPKGIVSAPEFEVQTWGEENVAVRAGDGATTATVALTTTTGKVKINATLRVVPENEPAYTLVRLVPASEEEAFQARVEMEVAKKLAPVRAQLAELARGQEARARTLAEQAITAGAMQRSGVETHQARERNNTHAIVHVPKAVLLGDTVYVLFELENRSKAPFRVAAVRVRSRRGAELAAVPYLGVAPDPRVKALGVVAKKAKVWGAVAVPFAELSRAGRFSLQVAEVDSRQSVSVGDLSL